MSVVNGAVSQSQSFSYYLEAIELGSYMIMPASIEVDGEILETSPIEIIVFPNPDGIQQPIESDQKMEWNPFHFEPMFPEGMEPKQRVNPNDPNDPKKVKKKRKIYKI